MLCLITGFVVRDRIKIKKTGFAGVALFSHLDLNTNKSGLVGEHVNEARMWDGNKILIVALAHARLLLPERVLADNDGSYPLFDKEVNNARTGCMQVVINAPVDR